MNVVVECPSCSSKQEIELEDGDPWECPNCEILLDVYDGDTETGYEVFIVQDDDLPLR